MSKKGKITVKHYLNTNLKSIIENGKERYPLYVQIIYNRKIYKFKSENDYFEYLSKTDLEIEFIVKMLNDELERVKRCVNLLVENNEKLLTSKDIKRLSKPLHIVIEDNFKKLIEKEITDAPKTITDLSYTENNNLLFFLNAFQDFDDKNEIVSNVRQCINIINYPDFKNYNFDYIAIDLYFGENYLKIYDDIFYYSTDKKTTAILIKNFQHLAEF